MEDFFFFICAEDEVVAVVVVSVLCGCVSLFWCRFIFSFLYRSAMKSNIDGELGDSLSIVFGGGGGGGGGCCCGCFLEGSAPGEDGVREL